jgi:hypothetical protein
MCSVLFYIASAMLLYSAMLVAFVSSSFAAPKWFAVGLFAGLGALLLCAGLTFKRFRAWRRDAGIVLLSASGVAATAALGIACMLLDENMMKLVAARSEGLAMFDDYIGGGSVLLGAALLGGLLLRSAAAR